VNPAICTTSIAADCDASNCRQRCALEVIDELLREHAQAVSGEEADLLLDLRWHLRQGSDAEGTLRLFCDLRIRMEQRHYLAFFRLRRWLENHLVASVQLCPAAEPHLTSVRFDRYCVEAIRRVCLWLRARARQCDDCPTRAIFVSGHHGRGAGDERGAGRGGLRCLILLRGESYSRVDLEEVARVRRQ